MRRIFSITVIAALISSAFSPYIMAATTCVGMSQTMSCHGGETASCDRHMHEHHHEAAPAESTASFSAVEDNAKCPMDCCSPGHPTTVASPSAASFLPPLAVSNRNISFASITFITVGFSSHTDRGPPLS